MRFFIIAPDEAVPKTFQNCKEIPLVVICKSQFESNFLVLASETTLTHAVYSRDRAYDHQVEEVDHREERKASRLIVTGGMTRLSLASCAF